MKGQLNLFLKALLHKDALPCLWLKWLKIASQQSASEQKLRWMPLHIEYLCIISPYFRSDDTASMLGNKHVTIRGICFFAIFQSFVPSSILLSTILYENQLGILLLSRVKSALGLCLFPSRSKIFAFNWWYRRGPMWTQVTSLQKCEWNEDFIIHRWCPPRLAVSNSCNGRIVPIAKYRHLININYKVKLRHSQSHPSIILWQIWILIILLKLYFKKVAQNNFRMSINGKPTFETHHVYNRQLWNARDYILYLFVVNDAMFWFFLIVHYIINCTNKKSI